MTRRLPVCPKCGHAELPGGLEKAKRAMALHFNSHTDMSEAEKIDAWRKLDFGVWPPRDDGRAQA